MFTQLSMRDYITKMAGTLFPSPKGGSVLAITGAMGAALLKMCCQVSANKNPLENRYQSFLQEGNFLMDEFLRLADEDTKTVYQMILVLRSPREDPEYCGEIQDALKDAADTLIQIEERTQELIDLAAALSPLCTPSCQADLDVVQTLAQASREAARRTANDNYRTMERLGCPLPGKHEEP